MRAFIATLALAGLAAAQSTGSANVVNNCGYTVFVSNVPASTSGESIISDSIAPGASYSQVYTQLSGAGGWSIKLSPEEGASQVLQYEYSLPNTGTIYYDLSQINGDPFNGNWALSANGNCEPEQSAYTYPTDDVAGMQACPQSSSVTLTLCN